MASINQDYNVMLSRASREAVRAVLTSQWQTTLEIVNHKIRSHSVVRRALMDLAADGIAESNAVPLKPAGYRVFWRLIDTSGALYPEDPRYNAQALAEVFNNYTFLPEEIGHAIRQQGHCYRKPW